MEYSTHTKEVANAFNLNPRDVLFCHLIASGADKAEAFYTIYEHGTKGTNMEQEKTKANEFFKLNPGANILVQKIKDRKQLTSQEAKNQVKKAIEQQDINNLSEEDLKKFTDKSYIIAQLAQAARGQTGKEKAQILMQIADLQRMKQEESKEQQEQRRFYLPFVSHCKTCKLLAILKRAIEAGSV